MDVSALLNQLEEVQKQKSTSRLSERNVVELITKLKQLGFLGDELLYTVNGKEYITTDRLKAEVISHLNLSGGRVLLSDLPAKIGVDLSHIERQAERVVKDPDSKIISYGNELIAIKYFDSMASEIDEMLREEGVLELGELARRFSLSREMIVNQLGERIGTFITARMEGGVLYTSQYNDRLKALLKGALRATSIPTNVITLVKELQISVGAGGGSVVTTLVEELIKSGCIKGILKGSGQTWIPDIYAENQKEAIKNFYLQNQFIEFDTVVKYGVQQPRKYLQDEFKQDGIALETVFVSRGLLEQLDAGIEEALGSGKWIDIMSLLPSVLSESDGTMLLGMASSTQSGTIVSGTCVMSNQFIDQLKEKAKDYASQAGQDALKTGVKNLQTTNNNTSKSGSSKNVDDDDEFEDRKGKGGKRKGGKGKGKGGKGKSGGADKGQSTTVANLWDPYMSSQFVPSIEMLQVQISEWYPDTDGAGEDADLPTALAQLIKPIAVEEFEKIVKAAFVADAEKVKVVREKLVKSIDESAFQFGLYLRGLELFTERVEIYQILGRHLVRQIGCELLDNLLQCLEIDSGQNSNQQQKGQRVLPLKDQDRNQILKSLSDEFAQSAKSLIEVWTKTSEPQEFYDAAFSAAELLGMRFRKIDKRVEKEQVQLFGNDLLEQLRATEDPVEGLSIVVPYLLSKLVGKMVSIPGRSIGDILDLILKEKLQEEQYEKLSDFHNLIFESLKVKGSQPERWEELNNQLLEKLPELVQIAESQ